MIAFRNTRSIPQGGNNNDRYGAKPEEAGDGEETNLKHLEEIESRLAVCENMLGIKDNDKGESNGKSSD